MRAELEKQHVEGETGEAEEGRGARKFTAEGIDSLNTQRDFGCASQKGKGRERERKSRVQTTS